MACWSQALTYQWFKYISISLLFTRFELNDIPLADTTIVKRILIRMGLHGTASSYLWQTWRGRARTWRGWPTMFSLAEHTSNVAQVHSIIPDVSTSLYSRSSFVFLGLLFGFAHLQHLTQVDIPILRVPWHHTAIFIIPNLNERRCPFDSTGP